MKTISLIMSLALILGACTNAHCCVQKITSEDVVTVGPDGSVDADRPSWWEMGLPGPGKN